MRGIVLSKLGFDSSGLPIVEASRFGCSGGAILHAAKQWRAKLLARRDAREGGRDNRLYVRRKPGRQDEILSYEMDSPDSDLP